MLETGVQEKVTNVKIYKYLFFVGDQLIKNEKVEEAFFTIEIEQVKCNEKKNAIDKFPGKTSARGLPQKLKGVKKTLMYEIHKHYNNFEVIAAYSNATPIRSHNGLVYTCCFCTKQCINPADLKTHTLMEHDTSDDRRKFMRKQDSSGYVLKLDITLLKCKICDISIDTLEELLEHLENEHKMLIYTDIKNQIFPLKFAGGSLQCAICSLVFKKYRVLLEHMHSHYKNYTCEVCDYGCINRKALLTHKESHKTGSFQCSVCNKIFGTQQKLRQHFYAVHKYKSYTTKCAICDERFKSNFIKEKHMVAVHGMTPVDNKCLACEKTFKSQNALRAHTKRYHLMERSFQCTECEMSFFSGVELKYHMAKHTGKKEFQCDLCLKWFSRKCVLYEHMHIHANDKRFTCSHCSRAFMHRNSWRAHMRSVHGEIACKTTST